MFLGLNKEINWSISNVISNIYHWAKLTFSKLWFSESKKFVSTSVFAELQLTKIFRCNLKIIGLGAKLRVCVCVCVCGFYLLILKGIMTYRSQKTHAFLTEKENFDQNETKSKMGNPTHGFRETNLMLQLA